MQSKVFELKATSPDELRVREQGPDAVSTRIDADRAPCCFGAHCSRLHVGRLQAPRPDFFGCFVLLLERAMQSDPHAVTEWLLSRRYAVRALTVPGLPCVVCYTWCCQCVMLPLWLVSLPLPHSVLMSLCLA
jgi:hypothetical protein